MVVALKMLILPALFILPWLLMKFTNQETHIWDALVQQPLLTGALLLPGVILALYYIIRQVRRSS